MGVARVGWGGGVIPGGGLPVDVYEPGGAGAGLHGYGKGRGAGGVYGYWGGGGYL